MLSPEADRRINDELRKIGESGLDKAVSEMVAKVRLRGPEYITGNRRKAETRGQAEADNILARAARGLPTNPGDRSHFSMAAVPAWRYLLAFGRSKDKAK